MLINELSGDLYERVNIPAEAVAATSRNFTVLRADRPIVVTGAVWIPNALIAGANTNNFAIGLVNKGNAGAGNTALSTVITYTTGTNAAANVPVDLQLLAPFQLAAGDVLALARTVNGTGMASPAGLVQVTYRNGAL